MTSIGTIIGTIIETTIERGGRSRKSMKKRRKIIFRSVCSNINQILSKCCIRKLRRINAINGSDKCGLISSKRSKEDGCLRVCIVRKVLVEGKGEKSIG